MGVQGLWRLLDAAGKPVPLELLEGKVLAVDVSIWLHQILQGYQDGQGNPVPNAHLLGIFNRICKLLYCRIKPVFVFDGGVPVLKKNTIAMRKKQKALAVKKVQKLKTDLVSNLIKRTAVKHVLDSNEMPKNEIAEPGCSLVEDLCRVSDISKTDMFKLPATNNCLEVCSSDEDDASLQTDSSDAVSPRKQTRWMGNIHNVDVTSTEFKALPPDVRHDILTDLKETRKQNSWGRLHEMPEEFHEFSKYQMGRLLKRRTVQESLEETEKEMGGRTMTLDELDSLLNEQGITTMVEDNGRHIAADNSTRFVYINGRYIKENTTKSSQPHTDVTRIPDVDNDVQIVEDIEEYEFEDELEEARSVTTRDAKKLKRKLKAHDMNPAMAYMLENSGLSQEEIMSLIELSKCNAKKPVANFKREDNETPTRKSKNMKNSTNSRTIQEMPRVKSDDVDETSGSIIGTEETNDSSEPESKINECNSVAEDRIDQAVAHRSLCTNQGMEAEGSADFNDAKVSAISSSDSESIDDFIEVGHVAHCDSENDQQSTCFLEIPIKPDLSLNNDDMFADIFSQESGAMKADASNEGNTIHGEIEVLIEDAKENSDERHSTFHDSLNTPVGPSTLKNEANANDLGPVSTKDTSTIDTLKTSVKESIEPLACDTNKSSAQDECTDFVDAGKKEVSADDETENNSNNVAPLPANRPEFYNVESQAQLEDEAQQLNKYIGRLEAQSMDVTDQMRMEVQELLRIFGVPYVVAPMEAEAQCAYLETLHLTDGTITDDSDIWLFGGQCVYKNFFNNNKNVLRFHQRDIQHHFKLARNQLIQLALLVGSDYTTGINGIGPVTALEILGAFPSGENNILGGLKDFRYWLKSGRTAMFTGRKTFLRTKLKNVNVEQGFPSEAVVQAYLDPTVDTSDDKFTWSEPNVTLLSDYTKEKFGWTKSKFDAVITPVLRRGKESDKQRRIDSYMHVKLDRREMKGTLSKRLQKAVQVLGNDIETDEPEPDETAATISRNSGPKRVRNRKARPSIENGKQAVGNSENHMVAEETKDNKESIKFTYIDGVMRKASTGEEYIPQREKGKASALKNKLRAIEVFRKSKKGPGYLRKSKRVRSKIKEEANLSESSDSS